MRFLITAIVFLGWGGWGLLAKPADGDRVAAKTWDPTKTHGKELEEWSGREFKGFDRKSQMDQDGLKAFRGIKEIPRQTARLASADQWDVARESDRPSWMDKKVERSEARIAVDEPLDWTERRFTTGEARGFDREIPIEPSRISTDQLNTDFDQTYRDSGKRYQGPEAELIRKELEAGFLDPRKEKTVDGHRLSIEAIQEMLNKP